MRLYQAIALLLFLILSVPVENLNVVTFAREAKTTPTPKIVLKGKIAYFSQKLGETISVLTLVNDDGTDLRVYAVGCGNWPGSWSVDGKYYAFFEGSEANPCVYGTLKIHVFNIAGLSLDQVRTAQERCENVLFEPL